MYFRQEHPTAWRSIAAAVAAVVVLGIVGGIIVLIHGGSGEAATDSGTEQHGSSSSAASEKSVCALPDGSQEIPRSGPQAEWDTLGAYKAPRSKTYGPGTIKDSIRSCYTHSPTGALFAAANRTSNTDAPGVSQVRLVEERFAKGPLFHKYLQLARTGKLDPSQASELESATLKGFKFNSYNSKSAQLEIVYLASLTDSTKTALIAEPVHMVWQDGDWKSYIDDVDAPVTNPNSLQGYDTWDGADQSSPDGTTGAAAPALGRVAPGWAIAKPALSTAATHAPMAAEAGGLCLSCGVLGGLKKAAQAPTDLLAGSAAGAVASSGFERVAQFFVDAMNYTLKNFLAAWMKLPDPDVSSQGSLTSWLTARTSALVAFLMVASVLISAMKIALTGQFEHMTQLGGAVLRTVLSGGLVATVLPLSLQVGDAYSDWILGQANPNLVKKGIQFAGFNPALLLIFGLFVMLLQVFQFFIMIFRSLAVMYLAVTVTLFAAGSSTRTGKSGFDKQLQWLVALVLYKPAAAVIYAGVFKLFSNKDLSSQMYGIVGMVLALVALPAFMRLLAPLTSALGGANAGALAGATIGAGIATGAMVASGGAAAGGGGLVGLSGGAGSASGAMTSGGATGVAGGAGAAATPPPAAAPPAGTSPSGAQGDSGRSGGSSTASVADIAGAIGQGASSGGSRLEQTASGAIDEEGEN